MNGTADLLESGAPAYYEESDVALARESLGSQLKLLEALLRSRPDDPRLLGLAAEGFAGYAFLFLEDSEPERAKTFYLRARGHALRSLARRKALASLAELGGDALPSTLKAAGPAEAPALFWAAFAWAGYANLSRDDPAAAAGLPKAALLMQRSHELAPEYHFGGSDLFFGVYFASRPKLLGGDPEKAREHFRWAALITKGDYLMAHVLEAKSLAVALQDKDLFRALLAKVKDGAAGTLPGARLADEVAKRKAAALLERIDDYF